MAAPPQVGIVGVKALVRDLKRIGDPQTGALLKDMREAGRAAITPVANEARSRVPQLTGGLAGSVRVSATRTGASVRMGSKKVLYAGPVEFGGYPAGREFVATGRYLFPAARDLAPAAARDYEAAINATFARYPWTNGGNQPEGIHD